jgi:hypothetical protein
MEYKLYYSLLLVPGDVKYGYLTREKIAIGKLSS